VYERYLRAQDEGLAVPELTPKTNMRWDLDPYTTAQRLTAHRSKRITLDNHPWPEHAPAVQVIERCSQTRTTVKVDFWCTCGFKDGLMLETSSGRLTFEDYPLPATEEQEPITTPAAAATAADITPTLEPTPPTVTLSKTKIQSLRRRQWSTRAITGTAPNWHREHATRERLRRAAMQLWEDTTVPTSLLQRARSFLTGRASA
jgi:hypothetical protein